MLFSHHARGVRARTGTTPLEEALGLYSAAQVLHLAAQGTAPGLLQGSSSIPAAWARQNGAEIDLKPQNLRSGAGLGTHLEKCT